MNAISKYKYKEDVEMMLAYYVPQLKAAKTKKEAEESVFWLQYLLQIIVEKYYEEKK